VTPCWLVCSSGRRATEEHQQRQRQKAPAQRNETLEEQLSKFRETREQVAKLQSKADMEELFAQPSKVVFVSV
jgi:hypothetical protein